MYVCSMYVYAYILYIYIYIYKNFYVIYKNVNIKNKTFIFKRVVFRLPYPRSGDSQGQETFLVPPAFKQTRNYDTEYSNHHPSL